METQQFGGILVDADQPGVFDATGCDRGGEALTQNRKTVVEVQCADNVASIGNY
jgi:hypothetical protein